MAVSDCAPEGQLKLIFIPVAHSHIVMVKPIALTGVEHKANMSIEMLDSNFTWNTSDAVIYIDSLLLRNIALNSSYSSRNWWVK